MSGRSVLVTGASQGIGLAIAGAFAAAGENVAICARDARALEAAASGLRLRYPQVRVIASAADVGSEPSVDKLFDGVRSEFGGLDVLVANAGMYGPKGGIEDVDWDAWVNAIRVNLLGVVYCARRALPLLRASARGKIVIMSGGGATKPFPFASAYAASKAGVVRFGETLAEELREVKIDVNMVAPGAVNTRMLDEVLAAGPEIFGEAFYAQMIKQRDSGGTPPEAGAQLCVFLASREADGITGKLISAVWDPWQLMSGAKERLDGDMYTLRRIVPEDRGWSW